MRWDTAIQNVGPRDTCVITQVHTGVRLEIPQVLLPYTTRSIRMVPHRSTDQPSGEVALPALPLDKQAVSQMLYQAGYPLIGWVPGLEHWFSDYYKSDIFFAIVQTVREMVAENGHFCVDVAQLQKRVGIKERTFTLHMLSAIEDGQGLVQIDPNTVRLSTWQDAMQASAAIVQSMVHHYPDGDCVVAECKLGITESTTLCDWMLKAGFKQQYPYHLFRLHPSVGASIQGDEQAIEAALQEHRLPGGWMATYGDNMSKHERLCKKHGIESVDESLAG